MDGEITHVTEEDNVCVLALAVHADRADGVLVDECASMARGCTRWGVLRLKERLLLKAVHEELEGLLGDAADILCQALVVKQIQPDVVLQ